jgi:hypothetical protein
LVDDKIRIIVGFSRPKRRHKPFPIFSWAIRAVERTRYSHVYVRWHSTGAGVDICYHASGTMVHFLGPSSFAEQIDVVEEFETFIEREKYRDLLRFCMLNAGVDYGIIGVIGIGLVKLVSCFKGCLNRDYEPENPFASGKTSQWCSKLMLAMFAALGKIKLEDKKKLEIAGPRMINKMIRASGDFRLISRDR